MDVMTAPGFWSGQDRMLTVEDMENMPDDEFRYELDDGVLIVSPAPSTLHQLAVTRLAVILSTACPADLVVLAGVGVNISHFQHRVPDVAVVRPASLRPSFRRLRRHSWSRSPRPGPGSTTGTGRRTSTRASASPRTGSSSRTGTVPN